MFNYSDFKWTPRLSSSFCMISFPSFYIFLSFLLAPDPRDFFKGFSALVFGASNLYSSLQEEKKK